jgi:hypothetical protein
MQSLQAENPACYFATYLRVWRMLGFNYRHAQTSLDFANISTHF